MIFFLLQEEYQFFDEIFAVIIVGLVAAILLTTFVYAVPKVKEILHKER